MPNNESDVHVVPEGDRWAVKRAGNEQALSMHDAQEEAAEAGRELARQEGVEFTLHGEDGQVREKDSYGNDPRDIPG